MPTDILREEEEAQLAFKRGLKIRGLTPISNLGGGNCVFMSLAQAVFGDVTKD